MLWMLAKVIFMTLIPKVECPHVSVLEPIIPPVISHHRKVISSISHVQPMDRPIQRIYKRKHIHIQRDQTQSTYRIFGHMEMFS